VPPGASPRWGMRRKSRLEGWCRWAGDSSCGHGFCSLLTAIVRAEEMSLLLRSEMVNVFIMQPLNALKGTAPFDLPSSPKPKPKPKSITETKTYGFPDMVVLVRRLWASHPVVIILRKQEHPYWWKKNWATRCSQVRFRGLSVELIFFGCLLWCVLKKWFALRFCIRRWWIL
jgi:hypothetical protein